jgi:ketosteroid isomerase-like protein
MRALRAPSCFIALQASYCVSRHGRDFLLRTLEFSMTRRQVAAAALVILVPALGACGSSAGEASPPEAARDRAALTASLRAADSALEAAVESKDAERAADLYLADATLLPIAEPAVVGRQAIRQEWAKTFGIPGFQNRARTIRLEVAAGGDLGFTQGTYESVMTGADGRPAVERGKWVTVWRRDADGRWRVVTDISNADAPPPAHQESVVGGKAERPGG